MVKPTLDEFKALAGQGNLAPIVQELPADLETPVSVYLKLRSGGPSFLLESVERGEQLGRYSFIGVHPPLVLTARGPTVTRGPQAAVFVIDDSFTSGYRLAGRTLLTREIDAAARILQQLRNGDHL